MLITYDSFEDWPSSDRNLMRGVKSNSSIKVFITVAAIKDKRRGMVCKKSGKFPVKNEPKPFRQTFWEKIKNRNFKFVPEKF